MQQSKIEWCDYTVSWWQNCRKPGAPRRLVKSAPAKLRRIQRQADAFREEHGHYPRVFFSSMCDVFDNAVDRAWRYDALAQIEAADKTNAILLTKRIGNVYQMIPAIWINRSWPRHVGLMITVVNQEEANRDIPKLLRLKDRLGIPWVGLSIEPMLGPVDLTDQEIHGGLSMSALTTFDDQKSHREGVDWVICGGESGPNARPVHPDWVRKLRDQCRAYDTSFLFKQWGAWSPGYSEHGNDLEYGLICNAKQHEWPEGYASFKVGKKAAGRLLDGREHTEFPRGMR